MYAPALALTPADVSSIKGLVKPYIDACLKRDWDKLLDMSTDDFVVLPPDEALLSDRKKIRTWLDAYPTIKQLEIEVDHVEGQDHFAMAYGHFNETLEVKGKTTKVNGKFVNTFRRDEHGKWLFACHTWNFNAPSAIR